MKSDTQKAPVLRTLFSSLTLAFLSCVITAISPTYAATAELSAEGDFYLELVEYIEAFVDSESNLTIDDVVQNPHYFKPVETRYIDFGGVLDGRAWLKVSIKNASGIAGVWRFDVNRQYYKALDIFVVSAEQTVEQVMHHRLTGSFLDRPIRDRMLGVDIAFEQLETLDIYLALEAEASTFMPLGIGTVEATLALHSKEHTLNTLVNGSLLTFVGFALILISVIGWRLALSFSCYILAGFAYIFHADGYTFVYLWPNSMTINDPMNLSLMVLMPVFGLLFSRALFNFKKTAPMFDRYILCYVGFAAMVSFLAIPIYNIPVLKVTGYLMAPLGSITQFCAAVIALRKGLLGAKPYFLGALIIMSSFVYALVAHILSGHFNHDATLDYGHFALVVEGLAFIAAIAVRLTGLRDERDRALKSELAATRERLSLSTQLQKAQDDFIHARNMADMRRNQLSSVSHDLQQPLLSLRAALNNMGHTDEDATQQMHSAFDYLETLAREQLAGDSEERVNDVYSAQESFSVSVVLDNVKEMFEDEAKSKGLGFRYRSLNSIVKTDPVALMRIVSNLVSNAIKHSESGGVLLAARKRGDRIRIEVWNTGEGMSEEELKRRLKPHEKGTESQGSGLGLSIVSNIANELGLGFEIYSRQGHGTVAFLHLPLP